MRWKVEGRAHDKAFATSGEANRYRSLLIAAQHRGERFDRDTGEPLSWQPRHPERAKASPRYHRPDAMSAPYEIREVEHLGQHRLRLTYADGLETVIDLADKVAGDIGPVFEPLRDAEFFAQVTIDHELGTIVWPNGADLAPDALHAQAVSAV